MRSDTTYYIPANHKPTISRSFWFKWLPWFIVGLAMWYMLACALIGLGAYAGERPTYELSEIRHDPQCPTKYLYFVPNKVIEHPAYSESQVRRLCNKLDGTEWMTAGGRKDLGCHVIVNGRHHIVYTVGKPHVYWHEIGHANGMTHNHKGQQ